MNLLAARVVFRDRTVADVLDLALRFVARERVAYAKLALVVLVPLVALAVGAGYTLGWDRGWLVAVPFAIAAELPFTVLASRLVFEDNVRVRDVVWAAIAEAPRALLARLLGTTLVLIALAFLVVPGVWLALVFLFLTEVMLLERTGIGPSLGRAQRLGGAAAGDMLVGVIVLGILPIAAVFFADFSGRTILGELLEFRPPPPVWVTGGSALAYAGAILVAPYIATARFLLYLNVRTRVEGWDIQTRFAGLAARGK